jgi:hypothetical protein
VAKTNNDTGAGMRGINADAPTKREQRCEYLLSMTMSNKPFIIYENAGGILNEEKEDDE